MRWMAIAIGCLSWATVLQAQLRAGDIAFVEYNTDDTDDFAWVALRTIPANTTICFTDSSVSNIWFRWTEHLGDVVSAGPLCWLHTNAVAAGTVIRWNGGVDARRWSLGTASGARPSLNSDGDQLVAYCGTISNNPALGAPWQGDAGGATLLHALNFANSGWDNSRGGESSTSFVPPGLGTNDGTAVHAGRLDNACYRGPVCGTPRGLLKAIADPANWSGSDDAPLPWSWTGEIAFEVKPPGTVFSIQ